MVGFGFGSVLGLRFGLVLRIGLLSSLKVIKLAILSCNCEAT